MWDHSDAPHQDPEFKVNDTKNNAHRTRMWDHSDAPHQDPQFKVNDTKNKEHRTKNVGPFGCTTSKIPNSN